ncbi:MAG: hypothetical protein HOC95_02240 [Candidatus Diapherotrites archaeon]|nr:hypothetical protein [Candidatus Diapherotrites archaeon]
MFDEDFEDPSFDMGAGDNYSDSGSGGQKGKIVGIAVLAIIVIAAFFAYTTFIGNQQTVTFNIVEMDGGPKAERLIVKDATGTQVFSDKISSTDLQLRPGRYTYTVSSLDYQPMSDSFTVDDDTAPIRIQLTRDVSGTMEVSLAKTRIYEGEEVNGTITISNNGGTLIDKLGLTYTSSVFEVVFSPAIVSIGAGGATGVDFTVKIKNDISAPADGSITFKLKGTMIGTSANLTANPAVPKSKVSIGKSTITDSTLKANQRKTLSYVLKNNDRAVPLENIKLEIIPNPGLEFEGRLDWFEFGLYSESKTIRVIDNIAPGSSEAIQIYIDVPVDAQEDDIFSGKLVISSPSMDDDLEINMTLTVSEGISYGLAFTGALSSYRSNCDFSSCETIRTLDSGLKLKNTGKNQALTNVVITVDESSDAVCETWLEIVNDSITSIGPEENIELNIIISPLYEAEKNYCFLKFTYDDPISGARDSILSQSMEIELNYSE